MTDKTKQQGPVEILCKEIGFRFDDRLETVQVLVAFVSVLVDHIADERWMKNAISAYTGKLPTDASEEAVRRTREMLTCTDRESLIKTAEAVHSFIDEASPGDDDPCDHLTDMLNSCVSAVRFGLEQPCRSRHAAEAANHVWERLYGISRFDEYTGAWEKDWARAQFEKALITVAALPST